MLLADSHMTMVVGENVCIPTPRFRLFCSDNKDDICRNIVAVRQIFINFVFVKVPRTQHLIRWRSEIMLRWLIFILLTGSCLAVGGQRTYFVSYQKDSEMPHRIFLHGDTIGLEIIGSGLMPTIVSERRINRISDDLFTIEETSNDSNRNDGVRIDYMAEYGLAGKTFRQEDAQLIDISNGRPYVNEDTLNSILGDFPMLITFNGKQVAPQQADSIRRLEGKRLKSSTLSGEEAYNAFGPAGIKGAIIMK